MFLSFFLHSGIMNKTYVLNVLNYEPVSVSVCVRLVAHAHARLLKKKKPNVFHPHPSVAFSCGAGLPLSLRVYQITEIYLLLYSKG